MTADTADIRQYLTSAYSDEELTTICWDYFRNVSNNFAEGMTKGQKIQLLLDHCQRRDLMPNLLAALERDRPDQYRKRFAPLVAESGPAAAPRGRDPHQVFISHAHEDAEFAHRLAADLQARGWRAWIAPDSIRPGEKWAEAIDRGLDESSVFVVVLTPFAVSSGWVKTETYAAIELAQRGEALFIPAEVAGCKPPMTWRAFQWIPFAGRYESGLTELLAAIETRAWRAGIEASAGFSGPRAQPAEASIPKDHLNTHSAAAQASVSQPAVPRVVPVPAAQPVPSPDLLTIESPAHLELVRVPAGEFLMGSDPKVDAQAYDDEQPQHRLTLPEFYIGKYPVTNEQYAAFVKATRRTVPQHWNNGQIPVGKEGHPVVNVTWQDAGAFCLWLSQASGKPLRLPTEAEWEKTARGRDGRIYPWGDKPPAKELGNLGGSVDATTPVGQYPAGASPCGALDMAGNVWEWTSSLWGKDWQKPKFGYPYDPKDGRENIGSPDAIRRMLRGGSWLDSQRYARCACRGRNVPIFFAGYIGFRVVVSQLLNL
jgi:formylglycine-generating enzyme required for sulfatase activity